MAKGMRKWIVVGIVSILLIAAVLYVRQRDTDEERLDFNNTIVFLESITQEDVGREIFIKYVIVNRLIYSYPAQRYYAIEEVQSWDIGTLIVQPRSDQWDDPLRAGDLKIGDVVSVSGILEMISNDGTAIINQAYVAKR